MAQYAKPRRCRFLETSSKTIHIPFDSTPNHPYFDGAITGNAWRILCAMQKIKPTFAIADEICRGGNFLPRTGWKISVKTRAHRRQIYSSVHADAFCPLRHTYWVFSPGKLKKSELEQLRRPSKPSTKYRQKKRGNGKRISVFQPNTVQSTASH